MLQQNGCITEPARREHRVFVRLYKSHQLRSLKDGHSHSRVYRRIDLEFKRMLRRGILPDDASIRRVSLAGTSYLTRTSVGAQLAFVEDREEEIKVYFEDHTDIDPTEGYELLLAACLRSGLAGDTPMASQPLTSLGARTRALPSTSERNRVWSEPQYMLSLMAAA